MKKAFLLLLALAAPAEAALKAKAVARLSDLEGKPVGTAQFDALSHGVLITFDLHGLPPGPHAIHLHTAGNCDAKTGFTSAGPILSLAPGKRHGYLAEGGPETGDLPNQFAGADGRLHASVVVSSFTIGNGKKSIFDKDGVAVIVDQRGDDYRTQPLGNAGNRIACGVVTRTRGPAVWKGPKKAKKSGGQYPVKIVLATASGANLANAHVSLTKGGAEVAGLDCDAPWILFKPPAGTYTATATLIGGGASAHSASFSTNGSGPQKEITIAFAVPAGVPSVASTDTSPVPANAAPKVTVPRQ